MTLAGKIDEIGGLTTKSHSPMFFFADLTGRQDLQTICRRGLKKTEVSIEQLNDLYTAIFFVGFFHTFSHFYRLCICLSPAAKTQMAS